MSQAKLKNSDEMDQPKGKKNWTLGLILFVSVLPVLAAYLAYFTGVGVPDNTVNHGQLLSPPLAVPRLLEEQVLDDVFADKKWRLLIPVAAQCDKECESNLYLTRQVHIRLGEKGLRVERLAVNLGAESGNGFLSSIKSEHPKLKQVDVDKSLWQRWIDESAFSQQGHTYFLVDQEGNAMMAYNNTHTGNQLLKDIKRALKYSIDYQ